VSNKRVFKLGIWGLGFGYFVFYTPYSGLTKAISNGLLAGMHAPVSGFELLPLSVAATVVGMLGFVTIVGWWKYVGRQRIMGLNVPFPRPSTFLSGLCMATIIATTTLAFSFSGSSVVFVLILLRGGILIVGPLVDSLMKRNVRWFSWMAMMVSLGALMVALADVSNYKVTVISVVNITAYLTAYFVRLRLMTKLVKSTDKAATVRYFVEEQMVATPALLTVLAIFAWIGKGDAMMGFHRGFTTFLGSSAVVPAILVGLSYAALCVCTTFIFLDRRENTFCISMHCGSSLLSGIVASYVLSVLYNQKPTSTAQYASAGLIVIALALLSPLHHLNVRALIASARKRRWFRGPMVADGNKLADATLMQRIFLFVCSGNTSRSPMAQAICNKEIAALLNISLGASRFKALSAGLTAKPGSPMTVDAQAALGKLDVKPHEHASSNLTDEMVREAEVIFCMTREQRAAVIEAFPVAAQKTHCLDPDGDIGDPSGKGAEAFLNCAMQLQNLIQQRFQEMGLVSL